jgi:hypothetical protein
VNYQPALEWASGHGSQPLVAVPDPRDTVNPAGTCENSTHERSDQTKGDDQGPGPGYPSTLASDGRSRNFRPEARIAPGTAQNRETVVRTAVE